MIPAGRRACTLAAPMVVAAAPIVVAVAPMVVGSGPGAGAFRPGPDEARRWAEQELAKDAYGTSYVERAWQWLLDRLAGLTPDGAGEVGGTPVPPALAVLGALVIAAVVIMIVRSRRRPPAGGAAEDDRAGQVFAGARLTASEYRRLAEKALAQRDTHLGAVQAFRAVTARLLERHLLDDADDRTAGEFATAAGHVFPSHRAELQAAARAFDQGRYGGPAPDPAGVRAVLSLDEALTKLAPRPADEVAPPPLLGAGR